MSSIHRESKQESYDVIVIGAGIGGLSAAALLAKAGKSVLLVERHDRPGGCAHGFSRRRYRFDAGVHLVSGCGAEGYRNGRIIHRIAQALGVSGETRFIPASPYARAAYPDLAVNLHSGEDAFVSALTERFPEERDNLRALSRLCRNVAEELMMAEEVLERAKSESISPARSLANLFRYRRATLAGVLDEFIADTRLKSAYASLWPYLGLPPSRLSFLSWATMAAGYTYEGGYYCRGTFQSYADLLAESLGKHGGELLLKASVRRICTERDRATGVILENGQIIRASAVISNIDTRQTAELLIGRDRLPDGYWDNIVRLSPSMSSFVVYLATDLDLSKHSAAHEAFFYESFDHDAAYAEAREGRPNWFSATVPTLADPELAPPGQHLMQLTALCPFHVGESWRTAKPAFQQRLLERAERHFPGLNERLLFVEAGSPRTVERYTLNFQGAAYGWDPTPGQMGANRPAVRGPLRGLFHAGHWTRPGGGVAGVSFSGMLAAQAVLDIGSQADFWRMMGVDEEGSRPRLAASMN
jgi:all-trans-retinol 13,14-reductase